MENTSPVLSPLSLASQEVFNAFTRNARPEPHHQREALAAALRALADQVVSADPCGDDCCIDLAVGIRSDILTIAINLENHE